MSTSVELARRRASARAAQAGKAVPFRDPTRQLRSPRFEWKRALEEAVDSGGCFGSRDVVSAFEAEWATATGAVAAEATASGSAALVLTLLALGVGPGDEVVTVPNTFVATVEAIELIGATPVLVDVDETTHTMDPARLPAALGPRTKAVMPVHLYGRPAELDAICEIAMGHGAAVVEEATQAAGAAYRGRACGSIGDVAAFSFGQSKPLAGFGEGGAVTTRSEAIAARLRLLNRHGQPEPHRHRLVGLNFRMHPLEAAVLRERLEARAYWLDRRREIAERYNAAFGRLGVLSNSVVPAGYRHAYYVYVIEVDDRDDVIGRLAREGIGCGVHYPTPIHLQSPHRRLGPPGSFPVSERLAGRVLSLPLYAELEDEEVERVVAVVSGVLESRA